MNIATFNIPSYPADRELFPSYDATNDEGRINTTFYNDFKIAERFGFAAVKDTFKRAFAEWKDNYDYVIELDIVLNNLCWNAYHNGDTELSRYYSDRYYEVQNYITECDEENGTYPRFTKEQIVRFYRIID